jgi:hypothetical protein
MKRNSLKVSSLLLAVTAFSFLLFSNSWAKTADEPMVIRKKISAQPDKIKNHKNFQNSVSDRKIPTLKPNSEITVPSNTLL